MKTLEELYRSHAGKVSDKWLLYVREYERIFSQYRDTSLSMLEIGVQNGGSLEIWSKYFPFARKFVGCDINPDCIILSYADSRISVVVGDANTDSAEREILSHSSNFDLIIDDGSHTSSDIAKSFARYFRYLNDGGIFVAEDLHCSYWEEFEGGLYYPHSSMAFFKHLTDVLNHEHWGVDKERKQLLRGFSEKFHIEFEENELANIHSIEFLNSVCVVRKRTDNSQRLGPRVVAGLEELVVPGHRELSGVRSLKPEQGTNSWSQANKAPEQTYRELGNLKQVLVARDEQVNQLTNNLDVADGLVSTLTRTVQDYQESVSWRITRPIRLAAKTVQKIAAALRLLFVLIANFKELGAIASKVKKEGLGSLGRVSQLLQTESYASDVSTVRDYSPEFLKALTILAGAYLAGKNWCLRNGLRRKVLENASAFFRGTTKGSKNPELSHIRYHIDKPTRIFNIARNSFVVSGWCVNLNAIAAGDVRVRVGKVICRTHRKQREDVQRCFASLVNCPPDVGFTALPALSVGAHRMWIDVKGVNGEWITVFRSIVIRMPEFLFERKKNNFTYKKWIRYEERRLKIEMPDLVRHIQVMPYKPIFAIVLDARMSIDGWKESLTAISRQIYKRFELYVMTEGDIRLPASLQERARLFGGEFRENIAGDYVVMVECGNKLSPDALYEFANALNQDPSLDFIYGDEDRLGESGQRCNPFHKPDWSPDYLETFNYIGFPSCFRTSTANELGGIRHLYEFILRFTERTDKICHISKVLGTVARKKGDNGALLNENKKDIAAIQGRLGRTGRQGTTREHPLHAGCYETRLSLSRTPLISIIIPTAGRVVEVGGRQIDLITNVVSDILNRSTYKNIEIIVVDNGDLSERQLESLTARGCKRITYSEPIFNISKKLNLGFSSAKGELLLLMNDDIEIISDEWIERMAEQFEKPHVGVVGAKLLYPGGLTQHVGVVHNHGNPDHVRRLQSREEAGYYFSTCGVRNYMAVTGAVMMTSARVFRDVAGYSEELAVSYNDVDFCLKVREAGLSILYTPFAELTHMESQSRVASADIKEVEYFHKRWAAVTASDPYYNEEFLSVVPSTFVPCINRRLL